MLLQASAPRAHSLNFSVETRSSGESAPNTARTNLLERLGMFQVARTSLRGKSCSQSSKTHSVCPVLGHGVNHMRWCLGPPASNCCAIQSSWWVVGDMCDQVSSPTSRLNSLAALPSARYHPVTAHPMLCPRIALSKLAFIAIDQLNPFPNKISF